jgi:uncharacterized membrane-anchored protein YitT (DUF2179 family)
MFIFNIPMLVLAYLLIGKGYALSTLYGTILLSAAIDITSF